MADFSLASAKAVHFFEQSPLCFTMFLTTTGKICRDHWIVTYIITVLAQSRFLFILEESGSRYGMGQSLALQRSKMYLISCYFHKIVFLNEETKNTFLSLTYIKG